FSTTTGPTSRWHSIGGPDIVYPDRQEEAKKLLTYTSPPLTQDLEITGAPQLTLHMSSSHEDGALHVYLEAVAPDGRVTYLTEGILSLRSRKVSDREPPYVMDTVYQSLERGDAQPMLQGQVEEVIVPLFNISTLIKEGYSLRVSIAGADKDTFARVPEEGDPSWSIHHSVAKPSFIEVPQKWRG
ncbi:MAG: CocE/NonD family hydrolase, partial [Pseudomonadota bacterium]